MSVKSQPQRTRYASMEMDEVESVVVVGVGSGFLFARVVHTRIDKVYIDAKTWYFGSQQIKI